jgi:PHD/YefM family antitoxin component YafN of YafNO toxin-antitoxin module
MTTIILSSREFNQDASGAKKAAANGPVFITDRGHPAYVLLTIVEYEKLVSAQKTLLEAIAQTQEGDFDFEVPRLSGLL